MMFGLLAFADRAGRLGDVCQRRETVSLSTWSALTHPW